MRIILAIVIVGAGIDFVLALRLGKYGWALLAAAAGALVAFYGERLRSKKLSGKSITPKYDIKDIAPQLIVGLVWLAGAVLLLTGH